MDLPASKRSSTWLVAALTALAFALRVYRLGIPELRGDETFGLLFSGQSLPDMLRQTLQFLEPHPPLDYLLLHGWTALTGDSEWALRFTSLAFGVAAVPLIYRLGSLLDSRETGVWAAALFAVNPFQLLHAQEARMYAISTALGIGSAVCLTWALRRNRPMDWAAFAVCSTANAYTHYYALFLIAALALFWLVAEPRRLWRPWLAAHAAIGLAYLPWLIAGWRVLAAYRGNGDSPGPGDMAVRSLQAFSLGQTLAAPVSSYFLPFFALAFAAGLILLLRQRPRSALFLALYLALPILAVFVSSLGRPVFNERYLAAMAPPFYLAIAAGIAGLARPRRLPARSASFGLAGLLLVGSLLSLHGYFFDPEFSRSRGWRELAAELDAKAEAGDVIVQNYPDPTLWYYYRGQVPHAVAPETRPADWSVTTAGLKQLGERYGRLWFVPYKSADWDADGRVGAWLDRHWERVSEQAAGGLALRQYRPARVALAEAQTTDTVWRDLIALRGFRVEPMMGDVARVRPGDALEITFYWEAVRPIPIDYTVFVHLQATGAKIVAQRDSRPVRGTYPTTQWEPGVQIVDPYVIIVPREATPGLYSIAVGFYQAPTGDRLKVGMGRPEELPDRFVLPLDIEIQP